MVQNTLPPGARREAARGPKKPGFFSAGASAMRAPVDLDPHTIAAALAPQLPRLATPALVIDLDAVDHNIAAMLRRAGDRWRPHLKTLKSSALLARLLAAGVTRCKVATLDELDLALTTADQHGVALDVLLAYPQHPDALRAALARAAASPRCAVHFLLDGPEHAALLAYALPLAQPLKLVGHHRRALVGVQVAGDLGRERPVGVAAE